MRLRLLAIPIVLTISACGAAPQATPPASSPPGAESPLPGGSPTPTKTPELPEILRFDAPLLGGGRVNGDEFVGKKLAVWLWAPWCGPCRRLAPEIAKAAKAFPNISFLGVPGQDSESAHAAFVDEFGLEDIPQAVDDSRNLWGHFGSSTQEAWLFIDADGEIKDRTRYGEMSAELLQQYLTELDAL